jgi:hypothetical protein
MPSRRKGRTAPAEPWSSPPARATGPMCFIKVRFLRPNSIMLSFRMIQVSMGRSILRGGEAALEAHKARHYALIGEGVGAGRPRARDGADGSSPVERR